MQLTIMLLALNIWSDAHIACLCVCVCVMLHLPEVVDATSHHVDSVDFLDCEHDVATANQNRNK